MPKSHTSKSRRRSRATVLEARVITPRIAWYGFLRFLGSLTKLACILAVLTGIGWGIWRGIERAFYHNPDFRLQAIDLNPNDVIDEAGLAAAAHIDLSSSLFEIHLEDVVSRLKALPEIQDATAARHLPGTLVVRVTPRTPCAWVACPEAGIPCERRPGDLLVDASGFAYPCPSLQLQAAAELPIVQLTRSDSKPLQPATTVTHPHLKHCFRLLNAARRADAEGIRWIESVRQANSWSLELVTRQGTVATFGLGDHDRQIASLQASLNHANEKGYSIGTINLIPKYNIPITLRTEPPAPRATPVPEPTPSDLRANRRARDLSTLLNRN